MHHGIISQAPADEKFRNAVMDGDLDQVKILAQTVNINALTYGYSSAEQHFYLTPLMHAIRSNQTQIALFLIAQEGLNPNILHEAKMIHFEDVDPWDDYCWETIHRKTASQHATEAGRTEIARALRQAKLIQQLETYLSDKKFSRTPLFEPHISKRDGAQNLLRILKSDNPTTAPRELEALKGHHNFAVMCRGSFFGYFSEFKKLFNEVNAFISPHPQEAYQAPQMARLFSIHRGEVGIASMSLNR